MIFMNRFIIALIMGLSACNSFSSDNFSDNEIREKSIECQKLVSYALKKHEQFAKGKSIEDLISEENNSTDSNKKKFYKITVIEILDTFPAWDDPVEKKRVNTDIKEHFYSICDPGKIKNIF